MLLFLHFLIVPWKTLRMMAPMLEPVIKQTLITFLFINRFWLDLQRIIRFKAAFSIKHYIGLFLSVFFFSFSKKNHGIVVKGSSADDCKNQVLAIYFEGVVGQVCSNQFQCKVVLVVFILRCNMCVVNFINIYTWMWYVQHTLSTNTQSKSCT